MFSSLMCHKLPWRYGVVGEKESTPCEFYESIPTIPALQQIQNRPNSQSSQFFAIFEFSLPIAATVGVVGLLLFLNFSVLNMM